MLHRHLAHFVLFLSTVVPATSAQTITDRSAAPHLRTTERRLRVLLDEGQRDSPTFRSLVQRLTASDVVVYLQTELRWPSHVDGRMTFASTAGGYRYIVVRLREQPSRARMLALIGHELRHAVEVAETPAIVDSASLAREYERLGFITRRATESGVAFDTDAAVDAGYRILAELQPDQAPSSRRRGRRTLAVSAAIRGQFGSGTEMNP